MAVLTDLLADFEAMHPAIRVEVIHIPDNYYQKLHILIAGGMTPDVVFTNSLSFPIYASHGIFRDLGPYLMSRDRVQGADGQRENGLKAADFFPQALAGFRMMAGEEAPAPGVIETSNRQENSDRQGIDASDVLNRQGIYALPRDVSNLVVFYNRDLFKKAGVPVPPSDWTWADLVQAGQRLTVDEDGDGRIDRFGFSFYRTPPLFWLPFIWSAGGDLFNADMTALSLDTDASLQGLTFYSDLRNKYHIAPKKTESGAATMSQLFLQQKLAMMVSGRWSVPVLRQQAGFDWDVLPLPAGPGGSLGSSTSGSKVGVDASGYAMAATTEHPDEAWQLIAFLLSRRSVEKFSESGLIIPARKDVAQSDLFLSPAKRPRHSQVFLDVIPQGVPTRTPPRWNEISEELVLALDPVWDGDQTPVEAIDAVKDDVNRMLNTGGR